MEVLYFDVVVVGGGGAALRAAIAAKEKNSELSVALLTKGNLGHSGVTAIACSDRMAFHATLEQTPPEGLKGWPLHAHDIYKLGGEVSDRGLAGVLAQNAHEAFDYLEKAGVPWVHRNGKVDQFITDGSDYPRACYTGPKTAVHIEEALVRKLGEYEITVLDNAMAYRLLKKGDRIVGLAAADVSREEVFLVGTPAVILATGGPGSAYKYNVYPSGMSGDGWAMAYEAGAELVNVEFIQFMISSVKTKLLLSGSMMRAVPRIVNELDEEILYKYLPVGISPQEVHNLIFSKGYQFPVSYEHPSHILDLAVFQECRAGHQVFIDFTRNPEGFLFEQINETFRARYQTEMVQDLGAGQRQDCPMNRLLEINPQALDIYKERGIDIAAGERIEVASAAQHFQGGVKMDAHGRTKVPGLWAVGETAGGHHGANRPGGNALMDCQVFGKIAGEDAAVVAAAAGDCRCTPDELIRLADVLFDSSISFDQERIKTVRSQIRNLLDQFAGVIRTQEGLSRAIEALEELENEVKQPCGRKGLAIALENRNMWFCALAILCASKLRNESRGPHLMFTDEKASALVPKDDLFWKKYIVLRQEGGKLVLSVKTPEQTT